ncbi:hypothetical protein PH547_29305 [Rhizobium sp. CNPSo 3464]|uniref:hypothetical protein n=1 Tax=Rhizobium sp. CNPSo 3464 TaxID=3021406 RepID=UPI00254C1792|nr:hypothetical protein [Rhizobium sp. CNPSo 3464]MDK4742991.1 hypothetical protein [Rhizobium sp. CNPSo 3464]
MMRSIHLTNRRSVIRVFYAQDRESGIKLLGNQAWLVRNKRGEVSAFPRPRSTDIVASHEFSRLKRHCLELLYEHGSTNTLPRLTPLGLGRGM